MDARAVTEQSDSGMMIDYKIVERITMLPVGDFGITNDNFWLGIGAMESNLGGRGMYAYGFYRYNTDHTIHLIFRNPYLSGSKWGIECEVKNLPVTEFVRTDTLLKHQFTDLGLSGKYELRFENDLHFGLSFRFQSAEYTIDDEGYTRKENLGVRLSLVPFAKWDIRKLDLVHFYISGWENNLYLEAAIPFSGDNTSVLLFYNEFRYYKRFAGKGNLAFRSLAGLSNEEYTVFSPFIADSYYNFRGIGYRAYKGNTLGLINLEYRQTVFENYLGGIQTIAFMDSGVLLNNEYTVTDSGFDRGIFTFAGIGARFIFIRAYNAILSIDYGMDMQNLGNGGWVFGWGQYF
jgi:hypothetical protein